MTSGIEARLGTERDALARLRQLRDDSLADLGGDPSARDWTSFRPLRRDPEEDWSDWLAQLIEDSTTGGFALALLGKIEHRSTHVDYIPEAVHREVSHEGYRADVVIEWRDASYTHIEVKVGDPGLAKTFETAKKMEMRFGSDRARRSDVVLLLPEQHWAWNAACSEQPRNARSSRRHHLDRRCPRAAKCLGPEGRRVRAMASLGARLLRCGRAGFAKAAGRSSSGGVVPLADTQRTRVGREVVRAEGGELMAGETSVIAFFREGLSHYPDARETVDYFENRVQMAISAAFDAKTTGRDSSPFAIPAEASRRPKSPGR